MSIHDPINPPKLIRAFADGNTICERPFLFSEMAHENVSESTSLRVKISNGGRKENNSAGMESEAVMGKVVMGILLLFTEFCLYCCIRVGSQEDDWMEEMERRRLEENDAEEKTE